MKKPVLLTLLLVATAMMISSGVGAQQPSHPPSQVRTLETVTGDKISPSGNYALLQIICDAPRGNIVYVTTGSNGDLAITAVHQPELCK